MKKERDQKLIIEDCPCCKGKGVLPTFFDDDLSSCLNCNGSGKLKYYEKPKITKSQFIDLVFEQIAANFFYFSMIAVIYVMTNLFVSDVISVIIGMIIISIIQTIIHLRCPAESSGRGASDGEGQRS